MQAPKQNINMNISDILWFDLVFWSHKEKCRKINNKIKNKEHKKDKHGNNKRKTTTKKKKHKTPKVKNKMNDTFAMNKVYEDDTWPWVDQRDNKKKPARVFWGCWPSTLLSILCFLFFIKTLFFPWKRVILFISHCLPFFLLGFFHFSFFTLCLSLSCFLFFLFLPCCLVDFFLPCFFVVISCLVSLRLFHEKNYIWKVFFHQLFLFWGVSFFVLPFKSLLFFFFFFFVFFFSCVFCKNVFSFQRRPCLKHSALCCALCEVIIFVKGRFLGQIWLMFEKHCKNRHFSTGLRALWSKHMRFSRVEGLGLRLLCGPGESVRVQAPKQNIKNKISGIEVFNGLILFFVSDAGPLKSLM